MQYTVNVSTNLQGSNSNMGVTVEAANVIDALDKAKTQLAETIKASGLQVAQ